MSRWKELAYGSQQVAETAQPTPVVSGYTPQRSKNVSSVPQSAGAKIYNVLEYLRHVPMHRPATVQEIAQATGVDLTMDDTVDQRLKNNPKVDVVGNTYAYKAKYDIKNRNQLIRTLDRIPDGLPKEDVIDCYVGVEKDLQDLTRTGSIICIKNVETSAEVYYPRLINFYSELSSKCIAQTGGYQVRSMKDLREDVRRGDAIKVGDHWFRVSSALKSSSSQTAPGFMAGMSSYSVSSTRDPVVTKRYRYMHKFDENQLPLDAPFPDDARSNRGMAMNFLTVQSDEAPMHGTQRNMLKHGCTNDIRKLWNETLRSWPTDRLSFNRELVRAGLSSKEFLEASRKLKKPRLKDKKQRAKKRAQRSIKISNQHLKGTALGEILAKGHDEEFTLGAVQFKKE